MLQTPGSNKAYRFRRFANKAYAAFASLKKEVTIGCVSHDICDRELLKAGKTTSLPVLKTFAADCDYQNTSDELPIAGVLALSGSVYTLVITCAQNSTEYPSRFATYLYKVSHAFPASGKGVGVFFCLNRIL